MIMGNAVLHLSLTILNMAIKLCKFCQQVVWLEWNINPIKKKKNVKDKLNNKREKEQ